MPRANFEAMTPAPALVDPAPILARRLAELAAEHEAAIAAIRTALATAPPDQHRALRADLRRTERAHARTRREIVRLSGPIVLW